MLRKILILEDNPIARKQLAAIIGQLSVKCEIYEMDNLNDAYRCALDKEIDLFIVDIILDTSSPSDTSGLKFIDNLRQIEKYVLIPVILVTSLEDPKMYAYDQLHCYCYLEKPFDPERVKGLIENCLKNPSNKKEGKSLYFRKDGIILSIDTGKIVYAECLKHSMHFHTTDGDTLIIPYVTMKKLMNEADTPNMVQCSRNTMINKTYVENVDHTNGIIRMKNNKRVSIGITFRNRIREIFK